MDFLWQISYSSKSKRGGIVCKRQEEYKVYFYELTLLTILCSFMRAEDFLHSTATRQVLNEPVLDALCFVFGLVIGFSFESFKSKNTREK